MPLRPLARGIFALAVAILFVGCNTVDDLDHLGSCDPTEGNLLADPSFELLGSGTTNAWGQYNATLTTTTGDGDQCGYALVMEGDAYAQLEQTVSFPTALVEGDVMRFTARARWVAGATDAPSVYLLPIAEGAVAQNFRLAGWVADGGWHAVSTEVTIPAGLDPVASASFGLVMATGSPETIMVDQTVLVLEP